MYGVLDNMEENKREGSMDVEMMSSETHFSVEIEPSALGWAGTWVLKKDRNNTNRGTESWPGWEIWRRL